jgi:hypothetical protein
VPPLQLSLHCVTSSSATAIPKQVEDALTSCMQTVSGAKTEFKNSTVVSAPVAIMEKAPMLSSQGLDTATAEENVEAVLTKQW